MTWLGDSLALPSFFLVDMTEWPGGSVGADVAEYPYASASPASESNCVPSLIANLETAQSLITIGPSRSDHFSGSGRGLESWLIPW